MEKVTVKMRKLFVVAVIMCTSLSLGIASAQDMTKVGLSVPTLEQDFYTLLADSAHAAAEEAGVELVVPETDALLDIEAELANVQSLLEAEIDVLLLYPVDAVQSLGAVEAAAEANIPIVMLDHDILRDTSDMESLSIVAVINADAEAVGASAAEFLCDTLDGEGTVLTLLGVGLSGEEEIELENIPAYQTVSAYATGIESYFADNCAGVTVVTEETETYTNVDSLTYFEDQIATNRPDAVIVADAPLTIDVIDTARRSRLRGLLVVGLERSDDVLGALEGGLLTLAIIPNPEELGSTAITTAVAIANGEEIEPMLTVDTIQVDADNAEQFRGPCLVPPC
jgi:ABC-type sugar transport system substrate-binding protein